MNPFNFFVALSLLLLSSQPQADKKLELTREFIENLKMSVASIQEGVQSMHSGVENLKTMMIHTGFKNDEQN